MVLDQAGEGGLVRICSVVQRHPVSIHHRHTFGHGDDETSVSRLRARRVAVQAGDGVIHVLRAQLRERQCRQVALVQIVIARERVGNRRLYRHLIRQQRNRELPLNLIAAVNLGVFVVVLHQVAVKLRSGIHLSVILTKRSRVDEPLRRSDGRAVGDGILGASLLATDNDVLIDPIHDVAHRPEDGIARIHGLVRTVRLLPLLDGHILTFHQGRGRHGIRQCVIIIPGQGRLIRVQDNRPSHITVCIFHAAVFLDIVHADDANILPVIADRRFALLEEGFVSAHRLHAGIEVHPIGCLVILAIVAVDRICRNLPIQCGHHGVNRIQFGLIFRLA